MKIAFASGKGGTGKSTIARTFANYIAKDKHVSLIDADVEEPNQLLFFKASTTEASKPVSLPIPVIDNDICSKCGACVKFCNYNALSLNKKGVTVFPELCHACGGCSMVCPINCISETPHEIGETTLAHNKNISLIQGKLAIGSSHATPLIEELLKRAPQNKTTIIDSPPGSACSLMAVANAVDAIVLVAEPTPFGLANLETVVDVCEELELLFGVVINRCNMGNTCVLDFCQKHDIEILAEIPWYYDVASSCQPISQLESHFNTQNNPMQKLAEAVSKWEAEC